MKLVLMFLSLAAGTAAVMKTVELMHQATAVMDQALEDARR